jgi:cysteine desulfurase
MSQVVYLDHHASTPVDPRVLDALLPYFSGRYGNPSSAQHAFGWEAGAAVNLAREEVARLLGATAPEICFTAGATEANNLAIFGVMRAYASRGDHLITQETEHKSVLAPARECERLGGRVTVVPVDKWGRVDPAAVEAAVTPATILISIMAANNEIGTLQPLAEIGKLAKSRGILFHTDAAQAVGKVPLDVRETGIDLLSFSGHKLYAPKGVGALFIRRRDPRVTLEPLILGGGHEGGLRSGTLNVPGIVGLGKACALAGAEMAEEAERVGRLREKLAAELARRFGPTQVNGHPEFRLPGNLHVTFPAATRPGVDAVMKRVAVSAGSACTTASNDPSHVLKAIGLSDDECRLSLRFGLGRTTTEADLDQAVADMADAFALSTV